MPNIERQEHMETKYWPFVVRYLCDCEKEVTFFGKEKPERVFKCWECLEKYNK